MNSKLFKLKTKVWLYEGESPWHFVTINEKTSKDIKMFETFPRRGFNSIPVEVLVGKTKWTTSIFPTKEKEYFLPIKKEVRKKENIIAGDYIDINLKILL